MYAVSILTLQYAHLSHCICVDLEKRNDAFEKGFTMWCSWDKELLGEPESQNWSPCDGVVYCVTSFCLFGQIPFECASFYHGFSLTHPYYSELLFYTVQWLFTDQLVPLSEGIYLCSWSASLMHHARLPWTWTGLDSYSATIVYTLTRSRLFIAELWILEWCLSEYVYKH